MNILIVDDQPAVIRGVLAGVNWERLGIGQQFTAGSCSEAKEILKQHSIKLMLCDIEMPMDSGLELYEWIVEEQYDVKCIFLTAHSDFSYVQKAIHLQSFDYLLQPADYQEIEAALQRAIDAVKREEIVSDYYQYARNMKKREKETLAAVLRDYLLKLRSDTEEVIEYLFLHSFQIEEESLCDSILLQCFDSEGQKWENELKQYAIDNVMQELLKEKLGKLVVICLKDEEYMVLYQTPKPEIKIEEELRQFHQVAENLFSCKVAIYLETAVMFRDLPEARRRLARYSRQNVTKKSGMMDTAGFQIEAKDYLRPDLKKWENFIEKGYFDLMAKEAEQYLNRVEQAGQMSEQVLWKFHQDYMSLFFNAVRGYEKEKPGDYFQEDSDYNYEAMMNAYTSLDRVRQLIAFTTEYLKSLKNSEGLEESRMEEILNYIHKNIQKNITRQDVADAVYLNPEYLSRLFHKEQGMKLSDYILQEKMNIGRHLLETTNFSVSIVASKVGYSNFSHFARAFKRVFGMSPSEIRQKTEAEENLE
ncbi:MAG: helix-turn-helix domain-containing protein [Lachnospiraceae bacterium]|nr:helix-turn-helix domain-containing protein [Lachnospiraceae bacterium]MCX4315881.1 response regulator [Lachnospiraceae bacterium]